MKKIISTLLAITFTVSTFPIVRAERDKIIPEIESGYTITYPEPANQEIIGNEYVYSEEKQTECFDYARLTNIVHKQNGADVEFLKYYDSTYIMSADEILSHYFVSEEISTLYAVNDNYDCDILMKLLVCFLESDLLTDEEKQAVVTELNNGVEIYYILKLFNDYTVLDFDIKEQLDNSFIVYYQTVRSRTEIYGDYADEVENFALENKYYTKQGTNLYIDDDSGNLQYKRTDASIPVRNGLNMELAVKYDLQEAYFDYYTKFANGYKEDPLGCGWLFDITYTKENIINLSDGRSIVIRGDSTKNNYYADIDYLYDEDEGKYCVAYRDGTREYFETAVNYSFQYICKKVDKYGNTIYYDIDTTDKKKINRIYNNRNDLDIRILYETDKTTATMPDNNKVIYYKEAAIYNYGEPEKKNYTHDTWLMSEVYDGTPEGIHAYFEYQLFDCWVYEATVNDCVESDSKAFAAMTCMGKILSAKGIE